MVPLSVAGSARTDADIVCVDAGVPGVRVCAAKRRGESVRAREEEERGRDGTATADPPIRRGQRAEYKWGLECAQQADR